MNVAHRDEKLISPCSFQHEKWLDANKLALHKKGRSTSDAVWAHRFIAAKAQVYKDLQGNIIGIDMSSAFDTIQ